MEKSKRYDRVDGQPIKTGFFNIVTQDGFHVRVVDENGATYVKIWKYDASDNDIEDEFKAQESDGLLKNSRFDRIVSADIVDGLDADYDDDGQMCWCVYRLADGAVLMSDSNLDCFIRNYSGKEIIWTDDNGPCYEDGTEIEWGEEF